MVTRSVWIPFLRITLNKKSYNCKLYLSFGLSTLKIWFCTQHSCMFTEVLSAFALLVQGAPHPHQLLMSDTWTKPYSREYAAFPAAWLRGAKFWPTTGMSKPHRLLIILMRSSFARSRKNLTVSKPSLLFFFAYYRTVREANRYHVQVVWTTCTGIAISSARCSRRPRWLRKQQPLLRNLVGIPDAAGETASRNCNACFL